VAAFDRPRARKAVAATIASRGFVVQPSELPTTHRRNASPLFTG
jgi:hypothetical protein